MAQKTIKTSIEINATPSEVWAVLTDFESYPSWNPFVKSLKGEMVVGQQIAIELEGMNFKPVLLKYEKNQELRWKGKLFFKGLFDGEHIFKIERLDANKVMFHHLEKFTGLLVGMFSKKLDEETKPGFEAMNQALKQKIELKN